MPPKLRRVVRLDSLPLNDTYYTEEGYLHDEPILTSTGIFEYTNPDGTIRRELRLPEEVFDPESLRSYLGKPVCITHDAGLIDKDNVHENQVGTILSEGYQSGNDVRAEIMIHDTDEMKRAGLKELSLGYNLDLDETPGVWKGKPYDAIQRNIRINHLALVLEARAGDQARLNIDSRAGKTMTGGNSMKKKTTARKASGNRARRADGLLSPEELEQAVAEYKARRALRTSQKDEDEPVESAPVPAIGGKPVTKAQEEVAEDDDEEEGNTIIGPSGNPPTDDPEAKAQFIRDRRDRRDEEGDPETQEEAMGMIAQQDEDIDSLLDLVDTLLAERDMRKAAADEGDDETEPTEIAEDDDEENPFANEENEDDECEENEDEDDEENEDDEDQLSEEENEDDDDDAIPNINENEVESPILNIDSVDKIVRRRVQLGMAGQMLHMDGLENMNLKKGMKKVIRAVHPGMRLDGKSSTYINTAFEFAMNDLKAKSKKDTKYQKRQTFNKDSRSTRAKGDTPMNARDRMIKRQAMNKKEGK